MPEWRNGRRAGLKIQCPQGRVGSSPTSGTHVKELLATRQKLFSFLHFEFDLVPPQGFAASLFSSFDDLEH